MLANSPPPRPKPNCAYAIADSRKTAATVRRGTRRAARIWLFQRRVAGRVKVDRRHSGNQPAIGFALGRHFPPFRIGEELGPVLLGGVAILMGDQIDERVLL